MLLVSETHCLGWDRSGELGAFCSSPLKTVCFEKGLDYAGAAIIGKDFLIVSNQKWLSQLVMQCHTPDTRLGSPYLRSTGKNRC